MNRTHIKWLPIVAALLFLGYQYFTSERFVNPETGRKSHVGLSTQQESVLGLQSYQQILSQSQTINSGPQVELVQRVVKRLASATGDAGKNFDWRVSVVQSDQINAFCLPGGKIIVYTGILPVANTESALATVLGHEMAHATSRHGAQRALEQNLTQTAMIGVAGSLSDMDYEKQRAILGAFGAGAQWNSSRRHFVFVDRGVSRGRNLFLEIGTDALAAHPCAVALLSAALVQHARWNGRGRGQQSEPSR